MTNVSGRSGAAVALAMVTALLLAPLWRFVSGRILWRKPSQWDARWESWAPEVPENVRRMRNQTYPYTRWGRRPGWQRQVVRLGSVAGLWAWLRYPVVVTVVVAVVVVAALVVWRSVAVWRRHHHEVVGSIVEPLAESLGWETTPPTQWIELPGRQWSWVPCDLPRVVWLLVTWLAADREQLAVYCSERLAHRLAAGRLRLGARWPRLGEGLERVAGWLSRGSELLARVRLPRREIPELADPASRVVVRYPASCSAHPNLVGEVRRVLCSRLPGGPWEAVHHEHRLEIEARHPRQLPGTVPIGRETFARYGYDRVPIGHDGERDAVVPVKDKTPHVSVAASTGWGKTTVANVFAGHELYHGAYGVFLDPKRVGYVSAFRTRPGSTQLLPNTELRTTLEGQIEAIGLVCAEMNRRYELIEHYLDRTDELGLPSMKDNPELYFMPLFLFEDEKGSLTVAIKGWWKREGGGIDDKGNPKPGKGVPEPLEFEQEILWRGRAAAVHMLTLAQQNNLNVFLNSDMRDQYMYRVLAGPQTQSSWVMTFPGAKKRSVPAKKGRAIVGIGAEGLTEIQLGRISDEEANLAAEHGIGVAARDNRVRAERLAMVTGRPLWEVSPLPMWVRGAAEIALGVPGQREAATAAVSTLRPVLVVGSGEDSRAVSDEDDGAETDPVADAAAADVFIPTQRRPDPSEEAERITGVDAAAEFLGMSRSAFDKARKRAKQTGGIPGEEICDGRPTWRPVDLREWQAQRPRAGRVQHDSEGK